MPISPPLVRAFTRLVGRQDIHDRADRIHYTDAGHGYDAFGMHPDYVAFGDTLLDWIYRHYFRVKVYNAENIPTEGPAILAANHSGTVPIDGAMVGLAVFRNTSPPRNPRAIADYFVSSLPFLGTFFARIGTVGGSRGNVRRLLETGNLLMLFPEGTPGIGKPFSERYQLQEWRKGHCELAIRHGAPVVPVGVVGAEEQMPQLARIPLGWTGLKAPYLPVPATPFPLPVRYHILFGEPLPFHREFQPEQADDPAVVQACADRVKASVHQLIHRGLAEREGVFR